MRASPTAHTTYPIWKCPPPPPPFFSKTRKQQEFCILFREFLYDAVIAKTTTSGDRKIGGLLQSANSASEEDV